MGDDVCVRCGKQEGYMGRYILEVDVVGPVCGPCLRGDDVVLTPCCGSRVRVRDAYWWGGGGGWQFAHCLACRVRDVLEESTMEDGVLWIPLHRLLEEDVTLSRFDDSPPWEDALIYRVVEALRGGDFQLRRKPRSDGGDV